jgi:N-acetylglucosamine kinase-like BadF-type ATPase
LYIVALDGGKTRTVCAILDAKGNILSYSSGRGIGTSLLDSRAVELNLRNVIFDALKHSSLGIEDIGVASFTACDIDTEELTKGMRKRILKLGFKGKVLLEPDYVGAYYVATHGKPGIGVIAGTGSIAYGENGHGKRARAGGWGWFIDDEGSGIWIGVKALNAFARAYDGMDEETSLLRMICKELNLRHCLDLVNIAYRNGNADVSLASRIAPLVDRAAEKGDSQAIEILQQAARELSLMVLTVSRKLGFGGDAYTVGCIGSVFKSKVVLGNFKEMLQREAKTVEFRGPYVDYLPLMGPVTMAFKESQGSSSFETLLKTINGNLNDISQPSRNQVSG